MPALKITELSNINALMKHENCGWAGNNFQNNGQNKCFSFVAPDYSALKIKLSGSVTWGISGFSFDADIVGGQVQYTLRPHQGCTQSFTYLEAATDLLLKRVDRAITDKASGVKTIFNPTNYVGPMLRASKTGKPLSATTVSNIQLYASRGIFDAAFEHFLTKTIGIGIICAKYGP